MEAMSFKKRVRDDSAELAINSPEVKRLKENLLEDLDDSEFCAAASQDLYSFMKSFEDEITASPLPAAELTVDDPMAESGVSLPDLGFLLEASDHDLGLPPPAASPSRVENELKTELVGVPSGSIEFGGGSWRLDEHIPSFDSFELGIVDSENLDFGGGEYVALDGLFDHSDLVFGSTDFLR